MKTNLLLATLGLLVAPITVVEAHTEVCALGYWFSFPTNGVHGHQAGCKDPEGKNYCENPNEWNVHRYSAPATGTVLLSFGDGNTLGDCNGDGVPNDYDGHFDSGRGGAMLSVTSGDGVTGGSGVCYGEVGHHPTFGPFTVTDFVFGATVPFTVASDTSNLVPPTDPTAPDCGDFTTDNHTTCVGTCSVTFPEGLDGAYIVYVGDIGAPGTLGHVQSP